MWGIRTIFLLIYFPLFQYYLLKCCLSSMEFISYLCQKSVEHIVCVYFWVLYSFFFFLMIRLSGFIKDSQDNKGLLRSLHYGPSSCQKLAQYWQSTVCTAYASWPSPSSSSLVWPPWKSDFYFPGTGHGTMDFTSKHVAGYLQSAQSLHPPLAQGSLIL